MYKPINDLFYGFMEWIMDLLNIFTVLPVSEVLWTIFRAEHIALLYREPFLNPNWASQPIGTKFVALLIVLQAYGVIIFLLQYAVPVATFAYCYGRIFQTIRHQSKVVAGHAGRGQDVPMATTSRDTGRIQQLQATGTTTGAKLSRTEMNVLKAMIGIIVCFMIFWSGGDIANFLVRTKVSTVFIRHFI